MALNLNVSPYYDDFDDAKNFHRILFKPGYAVQARELTQLQTILQSQVGKFGNHVFKNGAVISGCEESLDNKRPYVKIIDTETIYADIVDHYRTEKSGTDYYLEDRWFRDEGLNKIVPQAVSKLLVRQNISVTDISHFILPVPKVSPNL